MNLTLLLSTVYILGLGGAFKVAAIESGTAWFGFKLYEKLLIIFLCLVWPFTLVFGSIYQVFFKKA